MPGAYNAVQARVSSGGTLARSGAGTCMCRQTSKRHPGAVPRAAVVASEKGVVVGRLTFQEDGDVIDCARMGVGGKAIPPNVDKVRFHNSAACSLRPLLACLSLHFLALQFLAAGQASHVQVGQTGRSYFIT
jgi:hypothetical protein